jgi:hypothetical protein
MKAVRVFPVVLLAVTLLAGVVRAEPPAPPVRTRLTLAPSKLDLPGLRLEGFSARITPGQPALPENEVTVALHPRADLSTLRLEVKSGPVDTLPGRRQLRPNPPLPLVVGQRRFLHWGRSGTVLAGRDLEAYGEKIFPGQVVATHRTSNRRGLLVLHLRYTPLRYRHASQEVLLDRHTEVAVRYRLKDEQRFEPDAQILPYLGAVANAGQARGWYQAERADTAAKVGYAIVIPDALATASRKLSDFIKHKESRGMSVTVVRDADRAAIAVGPKEGDAERVRGWLQANYKQLNLKYVLLVGNPDPRRAGVPMKMTYSTLTSDDPILPPSDYYYADLTGNWDLNGNGKAAEYPDDAGTGGVDFTPEVLVGRIPIYSNNAKLLDAILEKTVAYATETGDRSWRSRVLQPAAILFYENEYGEPNYDVDGATAADVIFKEVIEPLGVTRTTLFETAGVQPSKSKTDLPLTRENVMAEWNKGYGLVTWFAHGLASSAFRTVWTSDDGNKIPDYEEVDSIPFLGYDDVSQLEDRRPAIVFHGSCLNAQPENPENIAAGLLRSGAVATIAATRSSVVFLGSTIKSAWSSMFGMARDLTGGLLQKKTLGQAQFDAAEKLGDELQDYSWLTKLEFVIYGDPSISLTACTEDADCDDGKLCTGRETCHLGQCNAGAPVACASEDPCTETVCEETTGECASSPRPEGEPCDDHTFCTVNDACHGGTCGGDPRCAAPGNPCVSPSCDEKKKTCDVHPTLEGETCHPGTDREGTCQAGICEPAAGGCGMGGAGTVPTGLLGLLVLGVGWGIFRRQRRPASATALKGKQSHAPPR